ncbi:MAG: tripartite tricarboxylate transporter permease [Propylenella sp.]
MEDLWLGFTVAVSLVNLAYCTGGVALGTAIGVLPGVGSVAAVSLLLPVTFYLDPTTALILLAGVYYGAEYGGSTASILLNIPGTPSSAVSCLEGYPMSRQGRAGVALCMSAIASFVGGTLGILVLMTLAPVVIAFALSFGAAEYFAAMLLALIIVASIARGSPLKGLAMVIVGLLLGGVGTDVISGVARFDLNFPQLYSGISVVVLAMGLFGVSEVIASVRITEGRAISANVTLRSMLPTRDDVRRSVFPVLRGFGIGSVIGPLPGIGPVVASFLSYAAEKRLARDPSRFGNGAIEGLTGPEASNNAAAQTAFIPMLTMGIPGTVTTAIMLGALMIHGIMPGPRLITEHPSLFWGVVASFWIGNVILLMLNIPLVGVWVNLLRIPYRYLYPVIICLVCIGTYSVNFSTFDVWLVLLLGALGYAMRLFGYEPAPLLISFILGPLLEENLRRAMLLSGGDPTVFFTRSLSLVLLLTSFAILGFMLIRSVVAGRGT